MEDIGNKLKLINNFIFEIVFPNDEVNLKNNNLLEENIKLQLLKEYDQYLKIYSCTNYYYFLKSCINYRIERIYKSATFKKLLHKINEKPNQFYLDNNVKSTLDFFALAINRNLNNEINDYQLEFTKSSNDISILDLISSDSSDINLKLDFQVNKILNLNDFSSEKYLIEKSIINNKKNIFIDYLYQGCFQNDFQCIYILFMLHTVKPDNFSKAYIYLHKLVYNIEFVSETTQILINNIELEYYKFMKKLFIHYENKGCLESSFCDNLMKLNDEIDENNTIYALQEPEIKFLKSTIEYLIELNLNSLEEVLEDHIKREDCLQEINHLLYLNGSYEDESERIYCYVFCLKRVVKRFLFVDNCFIKGINLCIINSKFCLSWVAYFLIEEFLFYYELFIDKNKKVKEKSYNNKNSDEILVNSEDDSLDYSDCNLNLKEDLNTDEFDDNFFNNKNLILKNFNTITNTNVNINSDKVKNEESNLNSFNKTYSSFYHEVCYFKLC
jgi:hypothetical protein